MLALIATGHLLGSVILLTLLLGLITRLSTWEIERNQKLALQEMSIELAIPVDELDKAEYQPKIIEFIAHRFSSELLRNRLSDFCARLPCRAAGPTRYRGGAGRRNRRGRYRGKHTRRTIAAPVRRLRPPG